MIRFGAVLGLALFGVTLLLGNVLAVETGTAAWTKRGVTLYEGPGTEYDVVGDVTGDIAIRVERCSNNWCKIRGEGLRGWTSRGALSFGQTSRGPLQGPKFNQGTGPGTVCLYEGRNYTGEALCRSSGTVFRDLLLYDVDNIYSSVEIVGGASVTLCRDRFFTSYCERVSESQPALNGFLDNNVSSARFY